MFGSEMKWSMKTWSGKDLPVLIPTRRTLNTRKILLKLKDRPKKKTGDFGGQHVFPKQIFRHLLPRKLQEIIFATAANPAPKCLHAPKPNTNSRIAGAAPAMVTMTVLPVIQSVNKN